MYVLVQFTVTVAVEDFMCEVKDENEEKHTLA